MATIQFPLTDDTRNFGFLATDTATRDVFRSKLHLLLLTETGEVYYNPEFGTNLKRFIFEPSDQSTQQDIAAEITRKVSRFIPGLEILEITFEDRTGTDNNRITATTYFRYPDGGTDALPIDFF